MNLVLFNLHKISLVLKYKSAKKVMQTVGGGILGETETTDWICSKTDQ